MIKISNCKELNPFDHYDILEKIDNKQICKLLNEINNKTVKLQGHTNTYIIHPSTKEADKIQCSIFYNDEPISDFVRDDYKSIIKELPFINLKIMEVIA